MFSLKSQYLSDKLWISNSRFNKGSNEKNLKIEKFKAITPVLKDAGYCKRDFPTMNQIKNYLRKEKKVSKQDLDIITEENVISSWANLIWLLLNTFLISFK